MSRNKKIACHDTDVPGSDGQPVTMFEQFRERAAAEYLRALNNSTPNPPTGEEE